MPTKYQYRSLEIQNFRSFEHLKLPDLKRINIIGGFNGAGKTSLLEVLFFSIDIANPIAIIKPYLWRGANPSDEEDLLFFLKDRESPAYIKTSGSRGDVSITLMKKDTPSSAIAARNSSLRKSPEDTRTSDSFGQTGIQIDAKWGDERISNFIFPETNGYSGNTLETTNPEMPVAIILSSGARSSANETATRISRLIKLKRINSVLEHLRIFQPKLRSFQIFQNGNEQSIYADLDGDYYSVSMLGDGFKNLLEVILAIGVSRNGCVFLDEIDASFHYSIVADAWKIISEAAAAENCQIFATSHSRETVLSAAKGIKAAGREKDFTYSRLSRLGDEHIVTNYNISELNDADEFNIEFR